MSSVTLMLLIVAVIVLLPIVPAFLLFKFLPSRADASGPLQGLEIKLGGAFAGYFILVVLILSQLAKLKEIASPEPQVWKVTGTVQDSHGRAIEPLGATDVSFDPYILRQERRGTFTATFAATPKASGIGFDFPTLSLSHDAEYAEPIQLSQKTADQLERDEQNHTIKLKTVRLLSAAAAGDYQPAGAPPQATQPASPPSGGQHEP
jgi:hypothetical protein